MTKKLGFTLAEVLITLGIIGVVAAMTIPTLMNNTGQAELKTAFKKAISVMNQAITMNVALDTSDFSTLSKETGTGTIFEMFNNRMNVIKSNTGSADAAWTGTPASAASNYTLYLNDGMIISYPDACGNSALNGSARNPVPAVSNMCAAIVDVNGVKKPNKLTNCASSATTTTEAGETCSDANLVVGDRFSIIFFNQQVLPNGPAAKYVMYK